MSKGISSSSRWSRCMKAPVRLLCSIRDMYVRGMTACAGKVGQYPGSSVAYPSYSDHSAYDRSFSSSSSRRSYDLFDDDDDLRELIRAASRARYVDRARADHVRRSQSVVVGRIDEDQPCEFKEDVTVGSSLIFPRSSSHAVGVGIKKKKKKKGHKANLFA